MKRRVREEERKSLKEERKGRELYGGMGGFVCLRISVCAPQGQLSQVGYESNPSLLHPQAAPYEGAPCPPLALALQFLVWLGSCLQELLCLPVLFLKWLPGGPATRVGGHQSIPQLLPSASFHSVMEEEPFR